MGGSSRHPFGPALSLSSGRPAAGRDGHGLRVAAAIIVMTVIFLVLILLAAAPRAVAAVC